MSKKQTIVKNSKGPNNGFYIVMGRTPFYRTSNEPEHHLSTIEQTPTRVHLLVIELVHPIFGFHRTNIESNRAFTGFTKLLFELTRTSFFRTSNKLLACSSIGNRTRTPHFWLRTSNFKHRNFGAVWDWLKLKSLNLAKIIILIILKV